MKRERDPTHGMRDVRRLEVGAGGGGGDPPQGQAVGCRLAEAGVVVPARAHLHAHLWGQPRWRIGPTLTEGVFRSD